jgi:hypothetical protein
MKQEIHSRRVKIAIPLMLIVILGCGLFPNSGSDMIQTPTPTFTPEGGMLVATSTVTKNRCEGVSGSLEMQVLAGPAEAVGMEPIAVGNIPFSVTQIGPIYAVQGNGALSYQQTLEESWGTYTVILDMTAVVSGDCSGDVGNEHLYMTVEASGEQMVEVRAEGFSGDYPWSGTHQLELSFPLVEGASAEGEGWAFILHLNE